jgi:MYXO-CTERM domain-containing protein
VKQLSPSGRALFCSSLAVLPDGRILLGGSDDFANGYVGRLLPNGVVDPGFNADEVPDRFKSVNALAVGAAGSIFVTGNDQTGFSGALIVRLLADGTLDTVFGRAGATSVDLKTRRFSFSSINDMKVVGNDALVVGGNSYSYWSYGSPFVARLLGNAAGGSPGVLSMKQGRVLGTEQDGRAVLSVRRTGGSQGAVAVTYATRDFPAPPLAGSEFAPGARAIGGADYTAATGRLTWADGEVGEREIVVPIASDSAAEKPEFLEVVLESPEGGAGLGAIGADVEIAGASYPVGDLTIGAGAPVVEEGATAAFFVYRNYYGQGAVSVTVRVATGGSATSGQDFRYEGKTDWQDVVLTWADGETGGKYLPVWIVGDGVAEQGETFTLELVSPTGGAMLGDTTRATVQINVSPAPPPVPPRSATGSGGGGGSFGWLGALLFGLGGALRRRQVRNR